MANLALSWTNIVILLDKWLTASSADAQKRERKKLYMQCYRSIFLKSRQIGIFNIYKELKCISKANNKTTRIQVTKYV